MGLYDALALQRLVDAGCPKCGSTKLLFRTYVDGLVPLMGGEPTGRVKWVYKGELFVDGIYRIACMGCEHEIFADDSCPRCNTARGLTRALETPNGWPVPLRCPSCEGEEVRYIAFLPATVTYEGKRAEKARSATEIHDDGFHGYRVDCRNCGTVSERLDGCPLCDAQGPLRPRPD